MNQAADIIIIGGGAAGCSAAMQLSARGKKVLVLERSLLGSGSTGRAAGLGAQLRESPDETRLLMQGIEVVKDIERRLGKVIFTRTGSLHVAADPARAAELQSLTRMGREIGFELDLVDEEFSRRALP
ncbi:MAG: FAD-dependent oxidoreductase, partial [Planctomycetota bacterium]|nr:FAD-dependent oxidoreductase [Planctomycetota bacterium]